MQRIKLKKQYATATNLNLRIEKHGPEEKVIALDVDFKMLVKVDWLNKLAIDTESDYDALMFDKNGEVKLTCIEKITFDSEFEEHGFIVTMDNKDKKSITLDDVTIKKISARPEFGHKVTVRFQVQCKPNSKQHEFLRNLATKDGAFIKMTEPAQGDLLEPSDEAA